MAIVRPPEHRLTIGTSPLVGQVAHRPEFPETATLDLRVQLADVLLDGGSFDLEPELADLLAEDAANLEATDRRVERVRITSIQPPELRLSAEQAGGE